MSGIPKHCTVCGVRLLNPHELTGLCREDKLILRTMRFEQRGAKTTHSVFDAEQPSCADEREKGVGSQRHTDTEE